MPNQVVEDHKCCVVCGNIVRKTCAHQTLRLFSSGHLAIITIPVASGLFTSSAHVVQSQEAYSDHSNIAVNTEICFYKDVTQHRSFHWSLILSVLLFVSSL